MPVQHHHHHIPLEAAEPLPVSSIRSVNASRVEKQVREHARDSFDKLTAAPPRNPQHSHHHGAAGSSSSARFIRIARHVLSDAELWTEVLESPGFIEVSTRIYISLCEYLANDDDADVICCLSQSMQSHGSAHSGMNVLSLLEVISFVIMTHSLHHAIMNSTRSPSLFSCGVLLC